MTEASIRRAAFRRVAADRNLRRALFGFAMFSISEFGTWVTVLVYAYSAGGTATVGAVAVIQLIPAALLAPVLADRLGRLSRSTAVTVAYGVQMVALAATALAMALGAPPALTIAFAVIANVAVSLGRPAHNSLIPELVDEPAALTAANVATTSIENLGVFIGPAMAGLVMAVGPPAGALALLAVCLAAGTATTVRIPRTPRVGRGHGHERVAGLRGLASTPGVAAGLAVGAVQQVAIGALDVLIVVLAIEELGLGEAGAGYLNAAMGLGGVLGGALAASMVGKARLTPTLGGAVVVRAAAIAAIGLTPWAAPFLAGAGAGYTVVDVADRTLLQRFVPVASLTRVFGLLEGLTMGGLAIGSLAAPLVVDLVGIRGAFPVMGFVLPAVLALVWGPLRSAEARTDIPIGTLSGLMATEAFAGLEPPVIEALARQARRTVIEPTTTVIVEGELGDRMWVVVSGTVDVTRGGEHVKTLGSGNVFGEIALLSDRPRIATVTTRTRVELLEIERSGFFDALAGAPAVRQAFEEMAHRRTVETLGD